MSKKLSNKIAFRAFLLLIVASCLYYVKPTWYWSQAVATISPNLQFQVRNEFTYGDLSEEFEVQASVSRLNTDVFEALKSDGYNPIALSMNTLGRNIQKQAETISAENLNQTFSAVLNNATGAEVKVSRSKSTSLTLLVPNVVHYIIFGTDQNFTFTHYLSFLSVERFIQPEKIFVHGDNIPSGHWWNLTIYNVRNIYHVKRTYSRTAPNGKAFKFAAHVSDYLRTEILLRYGGIYLDSDVLVVKSFEPLRQYSITLGRESHFGVCNGIIITEKGAPFLRLIREQYHSYTGNQEIWAEKSVVNTDRLAKLFPHLVHIEDTTLNQPNYRLRAVLYNGWFNWTQNYAIHLWMRLWPKQNLPNGFEDILVQKTTFAEVARLIVFGSSQARANMTGQLYGAHSSTQKRASD